jgi:hypothetical protein
MSYQLISKTLPKARKEYPCIWCSEKINIGEIHLKEVGEFDGDFQSNRWHEECHNAAQMYFKESGEDCFEPYGNERGSTKSKERTNSIYWRDQAADEVERREKVECELNNVIAAAAKNQSRINKKECDICENHGSSACDCVKNMMEPTMTIPTSEFLEMKKKLDDYNDWLHLFVELEDSGVPFFEQLHKKYGDKYKIAYGWRTEGKCAESEKLDTESPSKIPCPCITSNSKCNYACPCGDSVMSGVCVNCHNTGTILKELGQL